MPATAHTVTQQELAEALDKLRVQLLADIRALASLPFDDECRAMQRPAAGSPTSQPRTLAET